MRKEMGAHCLVLPYPMQGHINPMLQFSKRLQQKGVKVTFALTKFMHKTLHHQTSTSIPFETISDGYDDDGSSTLSPEYFARFQEVGSQTLADLVHRLRRSGSQVDCIVYDGFLPWALDVAHGLGLVGALFLTNSCAVDAIHWHARREESLGIPVSGSRMLGLPGLPGLEVSDLPSFVAVPELYPAFLKLVLSQFSNAEKADWVLVNSFYELEEQVVDSMTKKLPLRTIGPTIPSMYLDNRIQDNKDYGLNMFNSTTNDCIKWLDERPDGSVVYVSFGSVAELRVQQMEELAWGLRQSNHNFLWVVRSSEETKLPKGFMEETKGLVVSWCPQLDVLAHKATGCFVTHCGWNSTLEALSLGVSMVAMPRWSDQPTNGKYIADVWGMGIRVKCDEDSKIVMRGEVERCVKEVMEGEKGKEMKRNADKWKELAKKAVDDGGSSDKNIDEFVASLVRCKA